jgi:pimeloyl-ACP methyl ester carboxylesterase
MRAAVSSIVRVLSVFALIAAVFSAGLMFGALRERVLYEFPMNERTAAGADKAADRQNQAPAPVAVPQVALDQAALEARRVALEEKIFGGRRAPAQPAVEPLAVGDFVSGFLGAETFNTYYRDVFRNRDLRVEKIRGRFPEIDGYEWKSILIRQGKGVPAGLFLYHQGHDGDAFAFRAPNVVIRTMLERGYDVAVFSMPGIGWNRIGGNRIKTWDGWGYLADSNDKDHNPFAMIDTGAGHFIKFFVEPVLATLDLAFSRQGYASVIMAGHSGGGWTTTVAAALDPQIDVSVSYAGTLPFFARRTRGDRGDAEQFDSAFYRDFPYTLLYELASGGADAHRVHYQVYHSGDSCCFDGESVAAFQGYLHDRGQRSGRDLRVVVLRGAGHFVVSDAILDIIGHVGATEARR